MKRCGICVSVLLWAFFEVCHFAHAQTVVNVAAGGDVQAASLQVLAAGGGTINLAAGNYYINGPIVLGANTTVNGAGGPGSATQTVIYAPATPNAISMVTQAYQGASNLTVSNLVLDGNIPQAAMLYGTGNDTAYANPPYNNNGIYIYSTNNTTVGVTLTNVEVRHTLRGILTGLVDNLTISGCYFHDNNPGGFSHNMYLVATNGVEIDHTRSNNAMTGDGLHIDFGGSGFTIRKSEFSGNNGLGILDQNDNNVTIEDVKLDFNTNEGIESSGTGAFVLTRGEAIYNGGYGVDITSTSDNNGLVNGFYSNGNDPQGAGGDSGPDYIYGANLVDFSEYSPGPNAYPSIKADGVLGVADTGDMTLNYSGYTYVGAVDFNANHLTNGTIIFQVGNATATGSFPLNIRYSNGTSNNQTLNLSINGGTAVPVTFAPTGSYSTWATVTVNGTLNVGNNAVTLSVPSGATSAPELDLLTVTAATPSAPTAPTNLTATVNGPYSVTLNWTPPANNNGNAAQWYNVFRNGQLPLIATKVFGTTFTDTRIFYGESNVSYFVTASNQGGESGISNTVSVTTGIDAPPGLQVSVTPSTPANNLSWLGVSGAAYYLVRRSTVSGGPYSTIATVAANGANNSYSDTSLATGQTYYYVVAAEDSNGNTSVNSYEVKALSETFSLSASASSVNLSSATPDTISVVGTNGFSDAVNFAVSGLPTGVAASLSATSGSSTQITFTANTSATIGSYQVTVTGTDGNLTSSVGVTIVISSGQLAQVITFNAIPQQAVGNSLAPVATASSGLPVSFSVAQNGNCSVSNNVVTFLNGGACGIIASQAGNANFSAAANVGQVVQVGAPVAQTITFNPIPTQTAGTMLTLTATASSGLPVSYVSTTQNVCTVAGSTATLSAGGTCTITASQSGANQYGPAASVSRSFTVSPSQSQTINFAPASPVTYGVTPITLSASASSGLAVTYSYVSGPGTLNGNVLAVTGVGTIVIAANQAGNASYTAATPVSASIVVVPAALTVTANNLSRDYGVANPTLTYTPTGFVNGDTSAILTGAPTLSTTANTTSLPGTYPIAIAQGTLSAGNNYTLAFVNGTLQVTGTATTTTTLTPSPNSAVYGQSVTLNAKVLDANSNPVAGGTVSFSLYNAATNTASTFGTANVNSTTGIASVSTTSFPAGTQSIIAVYVPSTNYSASGTSGNVTITPAPIAITVNSATKVYGAAVPTLTGTLGATQNGDALGVSYTTTGTAASAVGTYPINATLTGNAAANYTATITPGVLSVTTATLTATATSLSRAYGAANPALTYSVTGFVNNDTSAILSGAPSVTTTATTTSAVGPYAITIAQGSLTAGNNYSFVLVAGVLTVTQATSQSIIFGAVGDTVYGSAPFSVSASASSGLPVTISVVSGNVSLSGSTATLIGGTVTVNGAGTVTLQASQAGNGNYPAAPPVQQSFHVVPATLTTTATSLSRAYGVANPALTYSATGFVNGDTSSILSGAPTLSTTATTTSLPGTYPITIGQGTLSAGNNYTLALANGTLQVTGTATTTTALSISTTSAVYGQSVALNATVLDANSNPVAGGTVSFSLYNTANNSASTFGTATVNTSTGIASFSTTSLPAGTDTIIAVYVPSTNYSASGTSTVVTITPAPVAVTVNPAMKAYGAALPTLSGSTGATQNGDVLSVNYSTTATTASGVGTYPITAMLTGASAANYTATVTPGVLTVTAATLTATATAINTTYGVAFTPTGTLSAAVGADTFTESFTTSAGATTPVPAGSYTITPAVTATGTTNAANYSISLVNGTLSVAKAGTTTQLSSSTGSANQGTAINFTATVASLTAGVPTQTVTLMDGMSVIGTATLNAGVATFAISNLGVGPHSISAMYGGDTNFLTSASSALAETVTSPALGTTTALTATPTSSTYGQSAAFNATVLDSNNHAVTGGTVTYSMQAVGTGAVMALGSAAVNSTTGIASFMTASLPAGSWIVSASYAAQLSYTSSAASINFNMGKVALTATANNINTTYGVALAPTGTLSSGVVAPDMFTETFTNSAGATTPVPVGSYTITPVVTAAAGTNAANYSITLVNGALVVAKAGTMTQLVASTSNANQGAAVNFTVTVASSTSGTPTQTVTLMDGSNVLGNATLNAGMATFAISSLGPGSHSISAMYSGDGNFLGSSSAAVTETVIVPSFNLSVTPASLNIPQGQSGSLVMTASGMGGYAGTLKASCASSSQLPCSFAPSSLTFTGVNSTQTMTVNIGTTAQARLNEPGSTKVFAAMFLWLPAMLAGMFALRRRNTWRAGLALGVLFLLPGLGGLAGCGGSVSPNLVAKGSYSFPLAISDGTTTLSQTVTVTVQ